MRLIAEHWAGLWRRLYLPLGILLIALILVPVENATGQQPTKVESPALDLTQSEQAWLAQHRDIRVGVNPAYPPFDFFDKNGVFSGLSADYMALIAQRLGVSFTIVKGLSWPEVTQGVKDGRIDVAVGIAPTNERKQSLNFTADYLTFPGVILTRDTHRVIASFGGLGDETVALVDSVASSEETLARFPNLKHIWVPSLLEALRAVERGKADATVMNLGSASYLLAKYGIRGVVVAAPAGVEDSRWAFGVRQDWPELVQVLDKVLASITPEEESAIREKWIAVPYDARVAADRFFAILIRVGGGAAIIVILVVLWNRRLKSEVRRRRAAEEAVARQMSLQSALVENLPALIAHKDTEGKFVGCNRAYAEAFGLRREDVIGKTVIDFDGFPAEQRRRGYEQDMAVLRTGEMLHVEEQIEFIDGKMHDVLLWRIPFAQADGKPGGLISITVDVSKQKAAERAVADQLAYQHALLDTVPNPIFMRDKDARFIGCNRAYEEAFHANREALIGKTVRELPHIPPEMRDAVYERDQEILRTGRPAFSAERLPFWDGPHDVLSWINRFNFADGSVGGIVGAIVDVSEQKALERQAQEAERKLREVTDNIPGAVYQISAGLDGSLDYTFVSEGIHVLRGVSREQVLADFDACMSQVLVEDRPGLEATIGKALSELVAVAYEYRVRLPDESVKWLRSEAVPNRQADGSIVLNGFSVDITAQKMAARALAEAERLLREIADSVPGVVYQLRIGADGSRGYTFMSDAVKSLRGYSCEEAIADYRLLFRQVVKQDKATIDRAIRRAIKTLAPMQEEFRIRMPDGTIKWLQSGAVPNRTDDGAVTLNGYWIDVTQHRDMEIELAAAKAVADSANHAKSSFLAAMSHEIRTPMNGVLGMLELLALTRLDAEQRANVEVVRESGRSLLRIVDDILDFSKIEAGMLDLRPEPASLAGIVHGVRDVYSGAASAKRLILGVRLDPNLSPAVMVDPLRLRQILNNFVSNALKFTLQGSITIAAQLVGRERGVDTVRFSITDTGIGISEENQKKLFQPFAQAEGDTTRRFGGTGLGLVICRRLADLMGGTIEMDSAPGRGTTMRLVVPLPHTDPAAIEQERNAATLTVGTLTSRRPAPSVDAAVAEGTLVLVADDHPTNRMMLLRQLSLLGYAAQAVEDGRQALEAWRSGRFALVLTDCHMPEMDGYELARSIRVAEPGNGRRIPIIACTANVLEGEAEACLAAGMDSYLAKPVELAFLLRMLDAWLPLPNGTAAPPRDVMEPPPTSAEGAEASPIDREKLAEVSLGDADFEREMLADFRSAIDEDANDLALALEAGDQVDIRRIAHRLKGASRAIGASDLAAVSERLEIAGRGADLAAISAATEPLFREVEKVRKHLAELQA